MKRKHFSGLVILAILILDFNVIVAKASDNQYFGNTYGDSTPIWIKDLGGPIHQIYQSVDSNIYVSMDNFGGLLDHGKVIPMGSNIYTQPKVLAFNQDGKLVNTINLQGSYFQGGLLESDGNILTDQLNDVTGSTCSGPSLEGIDKKSGSKLWTQGNPLCFADNSMLEQIGTFPNSTRPLSISTVNEGPFFIPQVLNTPSDAVWFEFSQTNLTGQQSDARTGNLRLLRTSYPFDFNGAAGKSLALPGLAHFVSSAEFSDKSLLILGSSSAMPQDQSPQAVAHVMNDESIDSSYNHKIIDFMNKSIPSVGQCATWHPVVVGLKQASSSQTYLDVAPSLDTTGMTCTNSLYELKLDNLGNPIKYSPRGATSATYDNQDTSDPNRFFFPKVPFFQVPQGFTTSFQVRSLSGRYVNSDHQIVSVPASGPTSFSFPVVDGHPRNILQSYLSDNSEVQAYDNYDATDGYQGTFLARVPTTPLGLSDSQIKNLGCNSTGCRISIANPPGTTFAVVVDSITNLHIGKSSNTTNPLGLTPVNGVTNRNINSVASKSGPITVKLDSAGYLNIPGSAFSDIPKSTDATTLTLAAVNQFAGKPDETGLSVDVVVHGLKGVSRSAGLIKKYGQKAKPPIKKIIKK